MNQAQAQELANRIEREIGFSSVLVTVHEIPYSENYCATIEQQPESPTWRIGNVNFFSRDHYEQWLQFIQACITEKELYDVVNK